MAFAASVVAFTSRFNQEVKQAVQTDSDAMVRPHSRIFGNPAARVTVVECLDPSCETVAPTKNLAPTLSNAGGRSTVTDLARFLGLWFRPGLGWGCQPPSHGAPITLTAGMRGGWASAAEHLLDRSADGDRRAFPWSFSHAVAVLCRRLPTTPLVAFEVRKTPAATPGQAWTAGLLSRACAY